MIKRPSHEDASNTHSALSDYAGVFLSIRKLIVEIGLIFFLLLGFLLLVIQILRTEIILDPIEVPENIRKKGWTEIAVTEKLVDAALNIQLETRHLASHSLWLKETENLQDIAMNANLQDITIPGSSFSIRDISRFIRQELGMGRHSLHIRGGIEEGNDGLILTLRKKSTDIVPSVRISRKDTKIEQFWNEGGRALLKLTNPMALAIHDTVKLPYSTEQKEAYTELVKLFEYSLVHLPVTDNVVIHALWGNALHDLKHPEEAIKQYRKAIELNQRYKHAYLGMGNALRDLKDPKEAIKQYEKAVAIEPKYAPAYNNWGNALRELKRPGEAEEKFMMAEKLEYH